MEYNGIQRDKATSMISRSISSFWPRTRRPKWLSNINKPWSSGPCTLGNTLRPYRPSGLPAFQAVFPTEEDSEAATESPLARATHMPCEVCWSARGWICVTGIYQRPSQRYETVKLSSEIRTNCVQGVCFTGPLSGPFKTFQNEPDSLMLTKFPCERWKTYSFMVPCTLDK